MANSKPKKTNKTKRVARQRLWLIIGIIIAFVYIWYYASQHGQWAELTKSNQLLESEKKELEQILSKKQRDQTIVLSDEAVNDKATKDLNMHRAKINERFYLPDPRDWKPESNAGKQ